MASDIFLFDYEAFASHIKPFIMKANDKQYVSIIEHAQGLVSGIKRKEWVLEGVGTSLKGFRKLDAQSIDDPIALAHQTGFSFLVMLSRFLQRLPRRFFDFGYGNITSLGAYSGWSEADNNLLENGLAYTTLLGFPDIEFSKTSETEWHNPEFFWLWFRPENCFHTEWRDVESVRHLNKLVSNMNIDFSQIDIDKLNLHPSVNELTLRADFYLAKALFSYAADYGKSIYKVVY